LCSTDDEFPNVEDFSSNNFKSSQNFENKIPLVFSFYPWPNIYVEFKTIIQVQMVEKLENITA